MKDLNPYCGVPGCTVCGDTYDLLEYLDRCIEFWRNARDNDSNPLAMYYIDAYQSMRIHVAGGVKED